jgi:hypothetical protein
MRIAVVMAVRENDYASVEAPTGRCVMMGAPVQRIEAT